MTFFRRPSAPRALVLLSLLGSATLAACSSPTPTNTNNTSDGSSSAGITTGLGTLVDLDGDGIADPFDVNGDGTIDGSGVDTNGDGIADAAGIDTNGDGIIDSLDLTGDGMIDVVGDPTPPAGTGGVLTGTGGPGTGGAATGTGGSAPVQGPGGPLAMGYIYKLRDLNPATPNNELNPDVEVLDSLPYQNVDVVVHAFVTAYEDGTVQELEDFPALRQAGLVDKVHAAGKKVVLSVGGANWPSDALFALHNNGLVDTFVANLAAKIVEWGYDGVDFDYEFPGNLGTAAQFTDFFQKLKTAVRANDPDAIIMFGVSPGYYIDSYEWANLGSIADYAFYFCYDWNNPEKGPMTAPGVDFGTSTGQTIEKSCRGAIDYMINNGFPAEKIVVGLGFSANGGALYLNAPPSIINGTPDPVSMEVSDGAGGWWPNAASMVMKTNAVLDPTQSVLTGGATVAGMGFWHWGQENATSGADLSTAIRTRLNEL